MITITDDDSVFVEDVITPTGRTEIVPTGGKRVEKCCRVQRNRIGFPFGRSPIRVELLSRYMDSILQGSATIEGSGPPLS